MSCWYRRSELGIRAAIFFSAAAVAGSFGGLLAAAIALMDGIGGKSGWACTLPILLARCLRYLLTPINQGSSSLRAWQRFSLACSAGGWFLTGRKPLVS